MSETTRLSPASERAVDGEWAQYTSWCRREGLEPLPASEETLVAYALWLAREWKDPRFFSRQPQRPGKSVSSVCKSLWAVCQMHPPAGYAVPDSAAARRWAELEGWMGFPRRAAPAASPAWLNQDATQTRAALLRDTALLHLHATFGAGPADLAALRTRDVLAGRNAVRVRASWVPGGEAVITAPAMVKALRDWKRVRLRAAGAGPFFVAVGRGGQIGGTRAGVKPAALSPHAVLAIIARHAGAGPQNTGTSG